MKKLLLLLLIPLFLGGCYDYNELNDLAIISGVGIDYKDGEFITTFEIASTKKEGEQSGSSSTYTVTSKANNLTEAMARNGDKLDKVPYFDHVDVVVISEDVAKGHLKEVGEYIIRTSKFRNEVYMVIAHDTTAQDILNTSSKEKPIASSYIVSLLEHSKNSNSASFYTPFTETLNSILTPGEDAVLSTVKKNEDKIELGGIGIFKDYELKHILSFKESMVFNLLNNFDTQSTIFEKSCGDKKMVMSIYDGDVKIEPGEKNVIVKAKFSGRIHEDGCNYNLRKEEAYLTLQKDFTNIIERDMNEVIEILKNKESNALNIGKNYYNKTRNKYYYKWIKQDFIYDIDLKINKKGLIFEVE